MAKFKTNPIDFLQLFHGSQGERVLTELIDKFYVPVYVAGGQEAERQTAYNAGAFAVVQYIIDRIQDGDKQPQSTK